MRGKLIMCGDSKALTEPEDQKRALEVERGTETQAEWERVEGTIRQTGHLSAKAGNQTDTLLNITRSLQR